MNESSMDEAMVQQLLDWLSRNIELIDISEWSEQTIAAYDRQFLREAGIVS